MTNTIIKWHNEDYDLGCNIKDLEKLGFSNSSYHNDLGPSYMNKKENIQIFFLDPNHLDIHAEGIDYKFSIMKLDEHGEYSKTIGTTNSFDEMVEMVKKNQ
jgi:hypothetical protein|tara:strand:- start:110 stop:412 length:303 start_codon:yes stop_codon:yes gene_type:complete